MRGDVIKGHLDLLILAILQDGPLHGYAVIEQLRMRSGGAFDMPEGTIYPALHRLESLGELSTTWAEHGGRKRKMYQLTPDGNAALSARRAGWQSFATAVAQTIGGPAWPATI
jgi:PadR family transcriptional regulator PadR